MNQQKVLKASSYHLEDALDLRLDERAYDGKITFLLLNQPPVCDAHCRRCFMPDYRRSLFDSHALTAEESEKALNDAREYGALCLEISGEGEPVLSAKLPGIIRHANDLGYMTTLITNGHNLDGNLIELCRGSNVTLVFSHHSLNPSHYEKDNNSPGSFERKMKNLELAADIYSGTAERIGNLDTYRLAIHATLQGDNIPDILELKEYCAQHGIFFSIAPLAQTGCAIEHPEMKPEDFVNVGEEIISLADIPKRLGDNSIIHSHSSARELGGREVCGTCFYGLNIGYDGSILFDAHSGYELGDRIGNIRNVPMEEAVRIQRKISKMLFANIDGFCPVRDPKWDGFLYKLLHDEMKIKCKA